MASPHELVVAKSPEAMGVKQLNYGVYMCKNKELQFKPSDDEDVETNQTLLNVSSF